jgi:hypothetical protein
MVYAERPPYEILKTRDISFPDMQRMRRFARYWDLMGNSGNFTGTLPLLWSDGPSPFAAMLALSDWLWATLRRTHEIALLTLAESLHTFLVTNVGIDRDAASEAIIRDWQRIGRRKRGNCEKTAAETAGPAPDALSALRISRASCR